MEYAIIFALVFLIFFVYGLRKSLTDRFDRLERQIKRLQEEVRNAKVTPPTRTTPVGEEVYRPMRPAQRKADDPPGQAPAVQPVGGEAPGPISPVQLAGDEPPGPISPAQRRSDTDRPGFFERHPDLEKFIGESLASKIGIAVLVLAIGFFVKYAIDNDWIGPPGRVGVGLLCGAILIGIAHRLHTQYKAFSSVLVGGGLAVLYFTVALAYHQYLLIGQTAAFVIMLFITIFSVLLSLLYNREELAIIALVGGFVTPFLVSNGRGDYVILFSYLLILNTGLLVIAYNRVWRLLNIIAFGLTVLLFASWLIGLPYKAGAGDFRGAWVFATAFYLLFFIINIAYTIRKNKRFIASDFGVLLLNTCMYFGVSLYLIDQLGLGGYKGVFCAVMAIVHLGVTWSLSRRRTVDKNILYLLIGITMSFVSLTAPLQLHGQFITMFWASESVLLYWLFQKSEIRLLGVGSMVVWAAMIASLGIVWVNFYVPKSDFIASHGPIIFNKGCMTGLYCAFCCGVLFVLGRKEKGGTAKMALLSCALLILLTGLFEIDYQVRYYFDIEGLSFTTCLAYTYLCILLFVLITGRWVKIDLRRLNTWLLASGVLLYVVTLPFVFSVQQVLLSRNQAGSDFLVHWIGNLLVILLIYRLIGQRRKGQLNIAPEPFTWAACAVVVILLSAEGQLLVNMLFYTGGNLPTLQRVYQKTGLPIVWGLSSFAFMWLGMRHKFRPLRIVSLSLFTITLLKLFVFDIRDIPIAGKIAAFFCLGVLLLVVSFMYQRLKKILIEDEGRDRVD